MNPKFVPAALVMLATLAGAAGCGKQEEPMGPAQKAGKAMDEAGEKVSQTLRDELAKADEAAKKVAREAEKAREKVADATKEAGKGLDKATEKVGEKVEQAGEKLQEAAR